jgi:hypothetical protein
MAAKKAESTGPKATEFDYSSFVPEGMSVKDLTVVESSLTPIYGAQEAFDNNWPPVCGWTNCFVVLPEQRQGTTTAFIPKAIKIVTEFPTKGIRGTKDEREVCDVEKGKEILLMLSGQLLQNKELLAAVADEKNSYFVIARIRGSKDIGQPQDMWDWEVLVNKKQPRKREGQFLLPIGGSRLDLVLGQEHGQTSTGAVYDSKTGELLNSAAS